MTLLVNGQRVDDTIVETEFASVKAYHESLGNVSCCERDPEFRATARQTVIGRVLLSQEAARTIAPAPEPEVDAAVARLMEDYGGEPWFFARTGASAETMHLVRRDVDLDLRVRRLLLELGDEGGPPTEQELLAYYQANLDSFKTAEEVRASHMLRTGHGLAVDGSPGEGRERSYDRLCKVRRQLLAGADFDDLAREHSEKADEHIDLGFFKRNELAAEFEAVAFSMEVGEISPVFASNFGFHLMKLTDRHPSVPRPFEEARPEIEKAYTEERRERRARELVERLRASADIGDVSEPAEQELIASGAAQSIE